LPKDLPALGGPLPFLYESTGDDTMFTDGFDPDPRSRQVFTFHRPEALAGGCDSGATTPMLARCGRG